MIIKVMFIVTILSYPLEMMAQDIRTGDGLRLLLTDIAELNDENQDMEYLLEMLENLSEHPVHINDADFNEMSRIFWLTDFQVNSLLNHIKTKGPVLSCYEIAYLYGFTPELARTMIPFISLDRKVPFDFSLSRAINYGKSKLSGGVKTTIQKQKGYSRADTVDNRYSGDPFSGYVKYSFHYADRVSWGITMDKDAGEEMFGHNKYGFDFYSFHFHFATKGWLNTLVLGDFRADFGQGLIMGSGLSYSKFGINTYNAGLRKYTSSNENQFMRGIGATASLTRFLKVSLFYSRKKVDATLAEGMDQGMTFSSLPTGGFHRTATEKLQKDAVLEQVIAGNISITRPGWHIGATSVYNQYDAVYIPRPSAYNYFSFNGRSNSIYSLDFRFRTGDVIFSGEQAIGRNGALGCIYSVQALLHERFNVTLFYRNYAKDFHSLYGKSLGENSRNNNEEGFYMGWKWNPGDLWTISSFVDIYRFPWLRYRVDAPSYGKEFQFRTDYIPSQKTMFYFQIRYKEKEENMESAVREIARAKTISGKLVFSHQLDGTGIENHLEVKKYRKGNLDSNGYFLSQDIYTTFLLWGNMIKFTVRFAVFDTDDHFSRIYSYENDMLYSFSVPSFSDQGLRSYLLLKYSLSKNMDLRFKYAISYYTNKTTVGSGLNEINGNKVSEVRIQLSCKF